MPPLTPKIALLTDYGTKDWYVASLKGVIARISPTADTIDITHEVEPGDVRSAAFILSQCYDDFPRGTIFLCVVDPGVGTDRKTLIHYDGDYYFVAPDNGLLDLLPSGMGRRFVIDRNRIPMQPKRSATFDGRDLLAPVAAMLAADCHPNTLAIPEPGLGHEGVDFPVVERTPITGRIIYCDKFGNATTNLKVAVETPPLQHVELADRTQIPLATCFAEVEEGAPLAYVASTGFLEIAINKGSASESLGLDLQSEITLH